MSESIHSPFARPALLLRLEAVAVLAAGCLLYGHLYPGRWLFFALCFLAPDLSLLVYPLLGARGGDLYNAAHWYALPLALEALSWAEGWTGAGAFGVVWLCHIAFDRLLGYGLKYRGSFRVTHLQRCADQAR